ncbi:hypothetical protein CL652_01280 [bacterium]|mgnify:CR=1 FL=1|nr:hypothetical protein [bacterium]|tara:strand:+ start:4675 stop:4908 length:234 start_codon:yes stop_codon:yes gene_type:complete
MKDVKNIIALGIIVALVPFLGFPASWKNVIFAFLGLAIAGLGYRVLVHIRAYQNPVRNEGEQDGARVGTEESKSAHE